jgi:hypothetical protein
MNRTIVFSNVIDSYHLVDERYIRVFTAILYENEFQNPQIFHQTVSLFPEHSTLASHLLPNTVPLSPRAK